MGTTSDKLKKLAATKSAIKTAIEGKGIEVADDATFAEYATTLADNVVTPLGQLGYSAEDEAVYADLQFDNSTLRSDLEYSNSLKGKYDGKYIYRSLFVSNYDIKFAPMINTKNGYDFYGMFNYANNLETVPLYDTSNASTMYWMFRHCQKLKTIPLLNTSKVSDMTGMFTDDTALQSVPLLDLSNCTVLSAMFNSCKALTEVPLFDISKATAINQMFSGCSSLKAVPKFDVSNVTEATQMCMSCSVLTDFAPTDFHSCQYFVYVFYGCTSLVTLPRLYTEKVEAIYSTFYGCTSLTTIDIDVMSCTNFNNTFYGCNKLTNATIRNIGTPETLTTMPLSAITAWGSGSDEARQTLVDSLLTYSFDRAAAGYDTMTIQLASAVKARLTTDEIAAITAKGYTIS